MSLSTESAPKERILLWGYLLEELLLFLIFRVWCRNFKGNLYPESFKTFVNLRNFWPHSSTDRIEVS